MWWIIEKIKRPRPRPGTFCAWTLTLTFSVHTSFPLTQYKLPIVSQGKGAILKRWRQSSGRFVPEICCETFEGAAFSLWKVTKFCQKFTLHNSNGINFECNYMRRSIGKSMFKDVDINFDVYVLKYTFFLCIITNVTFYRIRST